MDVRSVVLSVVLGWSMAMAWGTQAGGAADCGEPTAAPKYEVGEKWTWRDEKGREWSNEVVKVDEDFAQIKWHTGNVAFHDKDWIIQQVQKGSGELVTEQGTGEFTTIGQKVLDFPLQEGKKWQYRFVNQPTTRGGHIRTYLNKYTILGCEEVATPAGRFAAFKVEVDNRAVGDRLSGVYHLWYAPQVKNFVRRTFEPSPAWTKSDVRPYDLIKFEGK